MTIYGLIGSFSLSTLPNLNNLPYELLLDVTPIREEDPAIEKIFRELLKLNTNILGFSKFLNI